jgi:chemotaxis protein CheC
MLTATQQDALVELVNIATGRTAGSLSRLTGERVILDVPQVAIHPIGELSSVLAAFIRGEVATVHQIFSGPVSGDAFLLLDYQAAVTLVDLMTQEPIPGRRLTMSAREVLTEVGNILLNACLGLFGDLLQVRVSFSVPRLHLDTLAQLIESICVDQADLQYGLVIHTNFRLRDDAVSGYLVIVLGVASLDQLIQALERTS